MSTDKANVKCLTIFFYLSIGLMYNVCLFILCYSF